MGHRIVLVSLAGLLTAFASPDALAWNADQLIIHHINVSFGDATFIEFPNGVTWLIDTGNSDSDGDTIFNYIYNLGYTSSIDYLSASHFHADHVGGADMIIGPLVDGYLNYSTAAYHHAGSQVGGDSGATTTWRTLTNGSYGPAAAIPTPGASWSIDRKSVV